MPRPHSRRWPLPVLTVLLAALTLVRSGEPAREGPPARTGPTFTVPPGFIVERIAGPPLVEHPMMACFDERGRLFVAESAGMNLKAEELLKNPPNLIRLLEDTDGDGRFDKSTVFADKLTFPQGVLWHDGALYTAAPPSLWHLEDTDGDGVADRRHELVTRFGFTGNAADIHGPVLGPDGWLYWTDGRHGHTIRRPDGTTLQGKAARIFRCRPDGRDVEVVCGGGMDNPVEIAFTAAGEALATVDILVNRPRRNDAIIFCLEGAVYPYHDVLKEFKRTGDLLPPVAFLGWVAPAGLTRYRGDTLGADLRGNLFSAQFNTHRVQRHRLERDGATFRLHTADFLTSDDPDVHPTDVLEDADGSLLVIDTGGWFRIGCPTSQIAKPEIKGAIYRVRKRSATPPDDPRGLRLAWDKLAPDELARLLDDPRFAVRDRAVHLLAKHGPTALPALKAALAPQMTVRTRRNAVWALARIERPEARALVRSALDDPDESVRLAAAHTAGLNRDPAARPQLLARLADDTPAVRRNAATALGRLRHPEAVPALLAALRQGGDRFLEHALIYALIQIADREATLKGLADADPRVRRGALIALDQMDGGNLTRELVIPLLDTADAALQQTALAITTTHPDWAPAVVGLLRDWLARPELDESRRDGLRAVLFALARDEAVQAAIAEGLRSERMPAATRLFVLETIARVPLAKPPAAWVAELGRGLDHHDERIVRQSIATLRAFGLPDFDDRLLRLAHDPVRPADLRVAALVAASPRLMQVEPGDFTFLVAQLDKDHPPLVRLAAAEALGNARLGEEQLRQLLPAVAGAGALELPHLLAAYERGRGEELGMKLLAALDRAPGLANLSPDALQRTLAPYPEAVRRAAGPLVKRLAADAEQQRAKLAKLEPLLKGGNAQRGRAVFFGAKAACATCHTVKSEGGRVGPDLTTIGAIRSGRDLLEAVIIPSASFVRGYEPYVILTHDGRTHTGTIVQETADAVYLHTPEQVEVRVLRADIQAIQPGRTSIMPQGLDAQLSHTELADLLTYLQSLR